MKKTNKSQFRQFQVTHKVAMSLKRFFQRKERESEPTAPQEDSVPTMAHPYVSPILIPVRAEGNNRIITQLNLELDFKLSVLASKPEGQLAKLIAPLANLQIDYRGNRRYKPLWLGFTMITAFGLSEGENFRHGSLYKASICRGIKILVEADMRYEVDREFSWSQGFNYLTDGLRTNWTMNGISYFTRVNYPAAKGNVDMVNWLKTMGVNSRLDDMGSLVLIN